MTRSSHKEHRANRCHCRLELPGLGERFRSRRIETFRRNLDFSDEKAQAAPTRRRAPGPVFVTARPAMGGLSARTLKRGRRDRAALFYAKWFATLLAIEFVQDQDFWTAIEVRSDSAAHFFHVRRLAVSIKRSLVGIGLVEIEDRRILH